MKRGTAPASAPLQFQNLQKLRAKYLQDLPTKIEQIHHEWQALQSSITPAGLSDLQRLLHSLAGSAGTFGCAALGNLARTTELIFDRLDAEPLTQNLRVEIDKSLQDLFSCAATIDFEQEPPELSEESTPNANSQLIYLVEDDLLLANEIALQLATFGWDCQIFGKSDAALLACHTQRPEAVLVDIVLPEGRLAGTELIAQIRDLVKADLPCIVQSSRWDWEARLAAVRAGAAAYLSKPLDYFQLAEVLEKYVVQTTSRPFRVLIVDDTVTLAEHYAAVLEGAGMEAQIINNPETILSKLKEFKPELILMDLYMPGCNGNEVAKVIRQDREHLSVPIVFLSTESGLQKQLQAMDTGADDFLLKPISNSHLVTSVRNRVQRFRTIGELIRQDSMTGLLNHISFKMGLETEVMRAQRKRSPLCAVMLDIDNFKKINDNYGHPVGDRVIRSIAKLLSRHLRATDVIGRYGGEEFAVALVDCTHADAVSLLEKIRKQFASVVFTSEQERFSCTVSIGLATYRDGEPASELLQRADGALYVAKQSGRNQLSVADDSPHQGTT